MKAAEVDVQHFMLECTLFSILLDSYVTQKQSERDRSSVCRMDGRSNIDSPTQLCSCSRSRSWTVVVSRTPTTDVVRADG